MIVKLIGCDLARVGTIPAWLAIVNSLFKPPFFSLEVGTSSNCSS